MAETTIRNDVDLIIIGGSAGSLEGIMKILPSLSPGIRVSVVIVLHRKHNESILTELLVSRSGIPVVEAQDKMQIEPSNIYIAPADYHLLIEKNKTFSLDFSEKVNFSRPSIDVSFETAADAAGTSVAAILLSGANSDGTAGLHLIRKSGGLAIVQDPGEASVNFMPAHAISQKAYDFILTTEQMKNWIESFPANHQTLRGQLSP